MLCPGVVPYFESSTTSKHHSRSQVMKRCTK